jgi:formiminoglutamate deiminase
MELTNMVDDILYADTALLPQGWARRVRIEIVDGQFSRVTADGEARPGDTHCAIVLPTICNLHSHAFQRGMAGLAEHRGAGRDSFWTWRETMYRFALAVTPEHVEAIAAQLFVEMLEAGYSRVGEFHYLHHDLDGAPYRNPSEMAERIAGAAVATGIGITLLPTYYANSGFGGLPPSPEQRRFVSSPDTFERVLDGCRSLARAHDGVSCGIAAHSLRAVTPAQLDWVAKLAGTGPIHIHTAEQTREVDDCLAWSDKRPVEWLLDNAPLDPRWCLIHATHMTQDEAIALARTGAVAGLCPVTEANLGDGVFPGPAYLDAGGSFGVGTDSHVSIGLADELRMLEYSQRLRDHARNVLAEPSGRSSGRRLYDGAVQGGAQALGQGQSGLRPGAPADLLTLNGEHPCVQARAGDAILDSFVFGGAGAALDCVYTRGVRVVEHGRHLRREAVAARFREAIRSLASS